MAEIAIFAAIAWVIGFVANRIIDITPLRAIWINGGSITLAYVPIIMITYRRGMYAGILTGIILMLIGFIGPIYVIAGSWYKVFFQIGLDYLFPWPVVGLCGIFRKLYKKSSIKKSCVWLSLGLFVGGSLKFLCHFLAGVIFWGDFAPSGQSAMWYSFWYNGSQIIISVIISMIVLVILNITHNNFFNPEE